MKILSVVGARPNFMKIAPVISAINEYNKKIIASRAHNQTSQSVNSKVTPLTKIGITTRTDLIHHILVHTGQHYDDNMSDTFFRDLDLSKPDIYLGVGSASHAVQTARIMEYFEEVLLNEKPDILIVVGDVNSTLACALVASKIVYPSLTERLRRSKPLIAHIEAGLRSFDRTMPEEINRILIDAISDFLFTTEESANENLLKEGIPKEKIFFVGNTMIDTLIKYSKKAQKSPILRRLGLKNLEPLAQNSFNTSYSSFINYNLNLDSIPDVDQPKPYAVLTLHRPSNVDNKKTFQDILEALKEISSFIPIIFPIHPRTISRIKEFGLEKYFNFLQIEHSNILNNLPLTISHNTQSSNLQFPIYGINLIDTLSYLDFLCLMGNAKLVLTDSGGIQEETTVLGIPCITLRENTERPVTVTEGTNVVVGNDKSKIIKEVISALNNKNSGMIPKMWDGFAAHRIIDTLVNHVISP
jgi:UDP-N-acetylglucosamine 2-epimerase (non-hydrolysing)